MPHLDLPELARLITSVMPGDQIPCSGIATILWHPTAYDTMTALHIRKNTAQLLKLTASAVENAKVPTKADINQKVNKCRAIAAALIMPNDTAFTIQPKQGN